MRRTWAVFPPMGDRGWISDLETEMAVLVRRMRRNLVERAQEVHPDLTVLGYSTMFLIEQQGPTRAAHVVEVYHADKGAVSRQVQLAVDLGLIRRTPDPSDGRASLLELTPEGAARMQALAVRRRDALIERLGAWGEAELQDFVRLLGKYNRLLD